MENPICAVQNRTAGQQNPNPIAGNGIQSIRTPADTADDHDGRLQQLFSAVQNLAASRDSSDGVQHNPVCFHPPTPVKSGRRPLQTDFFREVALFSAHFSSEPESSRWAQFLPEYLRPGNLENYLKQTKKPQLFGNNFWWASQESAGEDCNSRPATVNQKKMPLVPDRQKDLQSSKPCSNSRRSDHIRYRRDQLLQLREVKTVPEAIMKIIHGIEVGFFGVNQMIEHGATIVDNSGSKRESGLTLEEKKEEKKVENSTVNDKQKTGKEAEQEGISKKKKRGMSDERKAKKKMKERKKRAEKNRKLGVKRLKIQPILKQKPVSHCRHYLKGRCYEGETCNFSHDVIPLTKSKPCSHFARQACMKGDDCPFDHQLSKYPCNNYVSSGHCNRGESCLFSHEINPKQDSGSATGTIMPETKSLYPSASSGSMKQTQIPFTSDGTPTHETRKVTVAIGTTDQLPHERKHLNFPLGASANNYQANLSQKSHFVFEAGVKSKETSASSTVKSSAQPYTLKSIKDNISTSKVNQPLKMPKGLTFLNPGNLQRNDSATDEQTSQKTSNAVEAGLLTNQGMMNNISNLGERKQSSFPTFGNSNLLVASAGDKKDSGDTNQKPNAVPFEFPPSTNASSSGKKSLLSALGFASKYDSGSRRNLIIGTEDNKSNSRTQQTESSINVNPSADENKNAGTSSIIETGNKKPANLFEMWELLHGDDSQSKR